MATFSNAQSTRPMVLLMAGEALTRVANRMRRQYGIASRRQLLSWGLTDGQVEGLVRRRSLVPQERGVYGLAGAVFCREQQAMAAVLRLHPVGRITGPFVLGLLRVEGFSLQDPFWVLHSTDRVQNVDFPIFVDPLPGRFSAKAGRLPSVTASRCLVECATEITGKRLRVAVDSSKWLGISSNGRLRNVVKAFGEHTGALQIRDLLDDGTLSAESEGERAMQLIFEGIEPQPEYQVWVTPRRRVDRFWRDVALAVEYLGDRHHSGLEAQAANAGRDRELRRVGIHVEYVVNADTLDVPATRARLLGARALRLAALGTA